MKPGNDAGAMHTAISVVTTTSLLCLFFIILDSVCCGKHRDRESVHRVFLRTTSVQKQGENISIYAAFTSYAVDGQHKLKISAAQLKFHFFFPALNRACSSYH